MDKKVYRATIWTKMTRHGDPLNPIERFFVSDLPYNRIVSVLKQIYEGMQLSLEVVKDIEELLQLALPQEASRTAEETETFARNVRVDLRQEPFAFEYEKARQLYVDAMNAMEKLARKAQEAMAAKEWVAERRGSEFLQNPSIDFNQGIATFETVPLKYDVVLSSLTIC